MTTPTTELRAEDRPMAPLDWSLLVSISLIWGSSFLFMSIALESFEPGLVTLLRVGFGFCTLVFLPAARRPIPRAAWPRVALLGFTWMALPLTMFPLAQQWIDSSMAGMLNAGMPIFATIVAWVGFNTPTGPRRMVGLLVGIVGIVMIGAPEASTAGTNAAGVVLVLVAVTSYGVAANIAGPLQREFGSVTVSARALAVATLLVTPFGLLDLPSSSFSGSSLAAVAAVGVGGTGVAYTIAATLNGRVGAVRMSIVTYVIPAVSIALGVLFRDETVTVWAIIGTVIVLVGAFLSSRVD
ncbi:MAG: DMT family transporter [Actinomycetota bacterium]